MTIYRTKEFDISIYRLADLGEKLNWETKGGDKLIQLLYWGKSFKHDAECHTWFAVFECNLHISPEIKFLP